jgi:hypothetical protein
MKELFNKAPARITFMRDIGGLLLGCAIVGFLMVAMAASKDMVATNATYMYLSATTVVGSLMVAYSYWRAYAK